jgi:hypothetical protein
LHDSFFQVIYNKLLPYSSHLDSESSEWWRTIKSELCNTLMKREVRPGAVIWITRMSKYIRFYGYKFPKADQIALIRKEEDKFA